MARWWRVSCCALAARRRYAGVMPLLALLIVAVVVLFVILPLIGMALWAVLSVIVVGLIIGGLGRLIIPGRQSIGWLRTLLAGLAGSIAGGFLGQHVLGIGHWLTVLLEIGLAALIVLLLARRPRRKLSPSTRP